MMYNGLIFTGDIHLRPDVPVCRTDDFLVAQWSKFDQIQKLAKRKNLAWIDAGDVFHKAIQPLHFVNQVLTRLYYPICAGVTGNHDLPSHNTGRIMESAWGTLRAVGYIEEALGSKPVCVNDGNHRVAEIYGAHYGETIPEPHDAKPGVFKVLVMHDMVYASRNDIIPNAPGSMAKKLLRDNKGYDLIITGHNHQSFSVEMGGRYVANIGSMTRQTADQVDHIPRVLTWIPGTTTSGLQWHTLDFKRDVVSREHIEKREAKEEHLNAFVESLQHVDQVSLSFEQNVDTIIQQTKPDKPVKDKVREAME